MADESVDSEERSFRRGIITLTNGAGLRERPETTIKIPISTFQRRMDYQTRRVHFKKQKRSRPAKYSGTFKENRIRVDNEFETVNTCVPRFFLRKRWSERDPFTLRTYSRPYPYVSMQTCVMNGRVMELVGRCRWFSAFLRWRQN